MNVVYCVTRDWVKHLELQIYCLLQHNRHVKNIYIIYEEGGQEEIGNLKYKIDDLAKLTPEPIFLHTQPVWKPEYTVRGRFSQATMYRLLLPDIILQEKVLYLDADTLVVANLEEFYNQELSNYVVGVQDVKISNRHLRSIGYMDKSRYLNAGVLIFNLELIRKQGLQKTWDYLARNKSYNANDQDIINITCGKCKDVVPNKYNSGLSCGFDATPSIVHFDGPKDPWVDKHPLSSYWYVWQSLYEKFKNEVRPN